MLAYISEILSVSPSSSLVGVPKSNCLTCPQITNITSLTVSISFFEMQPVVFPIWAIWLMLVLNFFCLVNASTLSSSPLCWLLGLIKGFGGCPKDVQDRRSALSHLWDPKCYACDYPIMKKYCKKHTQIYHKKGNKKAYAQKKNTCLGLVFLYKVDCRIAILLH